MAEKVEDPVCEMKIDKEEAEATYEYQGKTYYFCAAGCKKKFKQDPQKYVKN